MTKKDMKKRLEKAYLITKTEFLSGKFNSKNLILAKRIFLKR